MTEYATFANGCFWCTEAIFKRLRGVLSVMPGYAGGETAYPTYESVASGTTGHAEAVQITFDPSIISYEVLLDVFWHTHDPTTKNRQGNDIGSEYRSVIFYHSDAQKKAAEQSRQKIEQAHTYAAPIVTEIVPFTHFYPAEEKHRNFYESGQRPDYCRFVIDPKLQKLMKDYASLVG